MFLNSLHGKYLVRQTQIRTLSILLPLLLCTCSSFSQSPEVSITDEIIQQVEQTVNGYFAESRIPGISAAVVSDHEILWKTTLGTLDTGVSKRVDEETIFSIQSMSKSFTALAVLFAVQDGLVELDTPISKYIPEFKVNSRYEQIPEDIITLRHLLSHRSGLVHEAPFGNNSDLAFGWEEHIRSIETTWLLFPIGYCCSYSNCGFDLAAYILEKVSGKPYPQYLKEKVLRPLGMNHSSADFDYIEKVANRATGSGIESTEPLPIRFSMIGAGGVYSNLNDMTKYLMFNINKGMVNGKQILREDLMTEFHSIQSVYPDQNSGWALGLLKVNDVNEVLHAGAGFGFCSYGAMYPDYRFGVIFLSNSNPVGSFSGESFRFIDFRLLEHIGHSRPRLSVREMVSIDPKDPRIQAHIGRYGYGQAPELAFDGDTLIYSSFGNTYSINFYDYNNELVGLIGKDLVLKFMPSFDGQRGAAMVYHQAYGNSYNNFYFFNDSPTDKPGPNKPEWGKYIGEYEMWIGEKKLGSEKVTRRNGYLYWGEQKLTEYEEGLFFMYDGWELNFNEPTPRAGHIPIVKIK